MCVLEISDHHVRKILFYMIHSKLNTQSKAICCMLFYRFPGAAAATTTTTTSYYYYLLLLLKHPNNHPDCQTMKVYLL